MRPSSFVLAILFAFAACSGDEVRSDSQPDVLAPSLDGSPSSDGSSLSPGDGDSSLVDLEGFDVGDQGQGPTDRGLADGALPLPGCRTDADCLVFSGLNVCIEGTCCSGHACMECLDDRNCTLAARPHCRGYLCHACRTDDDCVNPEFPYCSSMWSFGSASCIQCNDDAHCPGDAFCDQGRCEQR